MARSMQGSVTVPAGVWTSSVTNTTTTFSIPTTPFTKKFGIDEFLALENKEYQKYVWLKHGVRGGSMITKFIDNEEKKGWYYIEENIGVNVKGTFFKKSRLSQWLVYDKATKKVKLSSQINMVFDKMIEDHIKYPELFQKFVRRPTATMCKKIIEGKICTIRDLMDYHRSYTLRNKSLNLEKIYEALVYDNLEYMYIFVDPNDAEYRKCPSHIDYEIFKTKPFEIYSKDVDKIRDMYDRWIKEKDKEFGCQQFGW